MRYRWPRKVIIRVNRFLLWWNTVLSCFTDNIDYAINWNTLFDTWKSWGLFDNTFLFFRRFDLKFQTMTSWASETNYSRISNKNARRGGGGTSSRVKLTGVVKIPKRYQDLVLWAWPKLPFTPRGTETKHITRPVDNLHRLLVLLYWTLSAFEGFRNHCHNFLCSLSENYINVPQYFWKLNTLRASKTAF